MKSTIKLLISLGLVMIFLFTACNQENLLEPTLSTSKSFETGINTVEDLYALLIGALDRMTGVAYYGRNVIIYGEARTDNAFSNGNSGRFMTISQRSYTPDDGYVSGTWAQIYRVIANANIMIAQDPTKLEGDQDLANHYIGEAYIIRALAHFDLLRLYGQQFINGADNTLGIPYVTEYKGEDLTPARNTVDEVKQQIYKDIDMGLSLMKEDLNDDSKEFITTWTGYALKARVAVYFGDWQIAKDAAEAVINSGQFSIADANDYAATFSDKGTDNVIFELAGRPQDNQGINGLSYIYRGHNYGDIQGTQDLYNIFDTTDVRGPAGGMIGIDGSGRVRNIGKYPTNQNFDYDIPLFRYEEVILNYAEALYHLGDNTNALTYLNMIPQHRNATTYTAVNEDNILLERRKELCFEGFRFDDLVRTGHSLPVYNSAGLLDHTLAPGDYRDAFPIPQNELNANKNMVQNYGY